MVYKYYEFKYRWGQQIDLRQSQLLASQMQIFSSPDQVPGSQSLESGDVFTGSEDIGSEVNVIIGEILEQVKSREEWGLKLLWVLPT